jgi:1-deoxy-D-xylulose-5-phosphate synthase
VLPVGDAVVELADRFGIVVTVEDGVRCGGVGARTAQRLSEEGVHTPVHALGLPHQFLPHASRPGLLAEAALDADGIEAAIARLVGPAPARLTLVDGHRRSSGLLR